MLVTAETDKEKLEKQLRQDASWFVGGLTGSLGGLTTGAVMDYLTKDDPGVTRKLRLAKAVGTAIPVTGALALAYNKYKKLKKGIAEWNEKYGPDHGLKKKASLRKFSGEFDISWLQDDPELRSVKYQLLGPDGDKRVNLPLSPNEDIGNWGTKEKPSTVNKRSRENAFAAERYYGQVNKENVDAGTKWLYGLTDSEFRTGHVPTHRMPLDEQKKDTSHSKNTKAYESAKVNKASDSTKPKSKISGKKLAIGGLGTLGLIGIGALAKHIYDKYKDK